MRTKRKVATADHSRLLLLELICRAVAARHSSLHIPALLFPFIHYLEYSVKRRRKQERVCVYMLMNVYRVFEYIEHVEKHQNILQKKYML